MIIWSTILYPSRFFETFFTQHFSAIKNQSIQNFTLLIFLDSLPRETEGKIRKFFFNTDIKLAFFHQSTPLLTPIQIRQFILNVAISLKAELLLFSDFDEVMDSHRLKCTMEQIQDFEFSYSNCYITDFNLKQLSPIDFCTAKHIPSQISSIHPILDKNFIGLGGLTLNLKKDFQPFCAPENIFAYDWFLATKMLLENKQGTLIQGSFTSYRQHPNSYIGSNHFLNLHSLHLGIKVKKSHYFYFQKDDLNYTQRLKEIVDLEKFLDSTTNTKKYIKIINQHFDPSTLSWWENIKTLEEIKQWI